VSYRVSAHGTRANSIVWTLPCSVDGTGIDRPKPRKAVQGTHVDCSRWLVGNHLPVCDLCGHTCPRAIHHSALHRPGMIPTFTHTDWRDIRLVAFDVDGTLYRQRPLRLRIGRDMVLHTIAKCDLTTISVVSTYRRIRERLAAEEVVDFDRLLIAETAKVTSRS